MYPFTKDFAGDMYSGGTVMVGLSDMFWAHIFIFMCLGSVILLKNDDDDNAYELVSIHLCSLFDDYSDIKFQRYSVTEIFI